MSRSNASRRAGPRSGQDRTRFEITGGGFVATGPDDAAVAEAAERVRQRIGFYGSTRAYWPVWEQHGLEDLGRELFWMSMKGEWDQMPSVVSDEVVALFAAIGRHDEIAARIEERFGGISDALLAGIEPSTMPDLPPDLIQDIQRIPCQFTGFGAKTAA